MAFAKVYRAVFKDGRVQYQLKRSDNGRLIAVYSSRSEAIAKRNKVNKFRAGLRKKKPRKKRG